MIIKLIEKLESSDSQIFHKLRGGIIKSKFTFVYNFFRFLKGISMIFDYRMYFLYSRKVFRDSLNEENQIFSRWINSLIEISNDDPKKIFEKNIVEPWMYAEAYLFIKSYLILNKNSYVFEYGSGSSTFYFSKYCKKLISIESDSNWHKLMSDFIYKNSFNNINLICNPPENDNNIQFLSKYKTAFKNFDYKNFQSYVNIIDKFEKSFDVIIIDGYCRSACIEKAIKKIKKKGLIVVDNSARERYQQGIKELNKISKRIDFKGPTSYGGGFDTNSIFIMNNA